MRVTQAVVVATLFLWVFQCTGAVAQDELDLDALLDDLAAPVVEEPTADAQTSVEVEAEEAPADIPEEVEPILEEPAEDLVAEDAFVEELTAEIEEVADPEPVVVEEEIDEWVAVPDEEVEMPEEAAEEAEEILEEEESALVVEEVLAEEMAEEVAEEAEVMEEVAAVEPAVEAAAALAAQEEVRRQGQEVEGLQSLENGYRAMEREEFDEAVSHFQTAIDKIPQRRVTMNDIERARRGFAEATYRTALLVYKSDDGDLKALTRTVEKALNQAPGHRGLRSLLRKIERKQERIAKLGELPVSVKERPNIIAREKKVAELLAEGIEFYKVGDYKGAEALFGEVLITDEFNTDAMRYLKKLKEKEFEISTRERDATVAGAMQKVRDSWNPPVIEEVELPEHVLEQKVVETKTSAEALREKMANIKIPSIEFREANIRDVVNFLVEASLAGDPEGNGVNIILNLNVGQAANAGGGMSEAPVQQDDFFGGVDEFEDFFEEEVAPARVARGPGARIPTITLNLRRISLLEALKIITEISGLRYRIEGSVVLITPVGYVTGPVVTRMYPVQPSILDVIVEREEESERSGEFIEMGGNRATMKRGDVKEFFQKAGVPFPIGTSITYNPGISQLIVANTAENLEIFERILAQLNVIPQQVEIEARFIEIAQGDLMEVGLQWMLTDNWEVAQKNGIGPVSTRERVQVNADSDGFSKGLRFFGFDRTTGTTSPGSAVTRGVSQSLLGGILSVSSVLTNPEVTMVLQALSQRGGSDLLSAPRVTTRSGVNAQIQVVREIIYPTEFEVTQPTIQSEGNLVTPPTVTPGGFETRETGVILNVTPTVGPDGYTIDLTMIPEVSELVDWIQYGSSTTLPIGESGGERTFTFNIPQPIFSSRNVTTSIVIWDGQTVVMGGLIREELTTIEDKIPLLGDIPILGQLFRSKGEHSEKRNLLIFVTARLVDPAGKPIHKAETMAMPGGSATTATGLENQ